jgi:hypothetical protein
MSFSRSLLLLSIVVVATALTAFAGSGGSTYSVLGLGDIRYLPGARNEGMGYTGISLLNSEYINPTAPATWSRINRTRVEASLLYEGFKTSDGRVSRNLGSTTFSGALMAIPISQNNGIVFVAGFSPYSNVDYNLVTKGSYVSDSSQVDYTLRHVGTGAIGQAQFGLSWSPGSPWSVGGSVSYLFGTIDNSMTMVSDQTTVATGSSTISSNLHGILGTVGAVYSGFGGSLSPLALGITATSAGSLHSTRDKKYTYSGGGQSSIGYDTLQLSDDRITIPLALGLGASWTFGERSVIAADLRTQAWGNSDFYGEKPAGIRNSQMIGVGFEQSGSRDASTPFLSHISYRFGFVYNTTYYQVSGSPVNEWAGTAGLTLPVSGDTRINLSLEYGARGKKSNSLIKENVFRLSASLSLGEMWFVQPEED